MAFDWFTTHLYMATQKTEPNRVTVSIDIRDVLPKLWRSILNYLVEIYEATERIHHQSTANCFILCGTICVKPQICVQHRKRREKNCQREYSFTLKPLEFAFVLLLWPHKCRQIKCIRHLLPFHFNNNETVMVWHRRKKKHSTKINFIQWLSTKTAA